MDRITLRVPKNMISQISDLVESGEYKNRSQAMRHSIDQMLEEERR